MHVLYCICTCIEARVSQTEWSASATHPALMASNGAKARRRAKQSKIVQNLTITKETAESLLNDDNNGKCTHRLYNYGALKR